MFLGQQERVGSERMLELDLLRRVITQPGLSFTLLRAEIA